MEKERAEIVITPVIKQLLPYFLLVSGQEDAVRLAKLLQAKYVSLLIYIAYVTMVDINLSLSLSLSSVGLSSQ